MNKIKKGWIISRSKNYNRNTKLLNGKIETEDGCTYIFSYDQITNYSSFFNIKEGLEVEIILYGNKKKQSVKQVNLAPTCYGFLESYNEKTKKGYFKLSNSEKVEFSSFHIRNEDEPIYDALYFFDRIKYSNKKYVIGRQVENKESPKVGQIRQGKIAKITKFGLFVDIGLGNDGLVHISEIYLEGNNDLFSTFKNKQIIKVLVIKVRNEGDVTKVDLSIKALEDHNKNIASNIFRLSNMSSHVKLIHLKNIIRRKDVLQEVKIYALHIINNDREIFRTISNVDIDKLYYDCKIILKDYMNKKMYHNALELLEEYIDHDFSSIHETSRFPDSFLKTIRSTKLQNEEPENLYTEDELEVKVFAQKYNCDERIVKMYLEALNSNSKDNDMIDELRNKLNIHPTLIIE